MRRIRYFINIAGHNIRRNLLLNIVSALTISLALLIMSAFLLLHLNLNKIIEQSVRTLTMSVYLEDNLPEDDTESLRSKITGLQGVADVRFISKDDALEEMKRRLGEDATILEGLDQNPLPASFEVILEDTIRDANGAESLSAEIMGLKGVSDIFYAWEWADKLKAFLRFIKTSGLVVGGLLLIAVVFIVANTIKLTIVARKEELYIVRLMGGTELFVRTPFILEGMFQGLCGGPFALILLYLGYRVLASFVAMPLGLSLMNLSFLPVSTCLSIVGGGILLGLLGSFVSLGRFMRT